MVLAADPRRPGQKTDTPEGPLPPAATRLKLSVERPPVNGHVWYAELELKLYVDPGKVALDPDGTVTVTNLAEVFSDDLELDPADHRQQLRLARTLKLAGEIEEAEEILRQVRAKEPDSTRAVLLHGILLWETGREDEGGELFEALLEAIALDSEKHHRLLSAVEKLLG